MIGMFIIVAITESDITILTFYLFPPYRELDTCVTDQTEMQLLLYINGLYLIYTFGNI